MPTDSTDINIDVLKQPEIEPQGCRSGLQGVGWLVGVMAVLYVMGWMLLIGWECSGWCERLGFVLFYGSGPFGAIFTAFTGDIVAAYPLEFSLWITIGFWIGTRHRLTTPKKLRIMGTIIGFCLIYGWLLSLVTEIERAN